MTLDVQHLIATRRDGGKHTREEIDRLAEAAAHGDIPDYQLSAWLMAAYLRPLSIEETAWLTLALAGSGARLDLTGLPKPWVDKHSTGGVGDKTTIALLPILAACGLTLVKMSGRGLGITGGTIDKLASVPGFRTDLSPAQMKEQALRIGIALTGQTPDLAPADKVLYALRDATGTVGSVPLIVSSVLSKKIAGGAETIVLDVKCGSGALAKTEAQVHELASALRHVAVECGLNVRVALTDMEQPLGAAAGNALEVVEAIRFLRNDPGSPQEERFRSLCHDLAGLTLQAVGMGDRSASEEAVRSGRALEKMRVWFEAQGAAEDVISEPERLPRARTVRLIENPHGAGWVERMDANTVGQGVVRLGGGRKRKEDLIDPGVGIVLRAHVGCRVEAGQPLFEVHASDEATLEKVAARVLQGITVSPEPVPERPLVLEVL
jgi:pyrimidine-nucleoside phosphorylase